jgi:hypothetical protein
VNRSARWDTPGMVVLLAIVVLDETWDEVAAWLAARLKP